MASTRRGSIAQTLGAHFAGGAGQAAGMGKPVPSTIRMTNWRADTAALKERGSLRIWPDPQMEWLAAPSGRRGRPAIVSDAAMQICLMLKELYGLPLRQATGLMASLLTLARLDWPVPNVSTFRRQQVLTVTIPHRHRRPAGYGAPGRWGSGAARPQGELLSRACSRRRNEIETAQGLGSRAHSPPSRPAPRLTLSPDVVHERT